MDLFSLLSPGEHGQKEAKKRRTEVMAMGIAEEDDGANAEDERGEAEDTYSEQAPYFGRTSWHKTSTGATSSGTAGDRWSPAALAAMPKVGIAARVAGSSSAASDPSASRGEAARVYARACFFFTFRCYVGPDGAQHNIGK